MTSDHHGRVTGIATSLLTAMDEILGTHTFPAHRIRRTPVLGCLINEYEAVP
jgi:hypothetical protein